MRIRIKNARIIHRVTLELEVSEKAWEQYMEDKDVDALAYNADSEFLEEDIDENECDYDFWTSDLKVEDV